MSGESGEIKPKAQKTNDKQKSNTKNQEQKALRTRVACCNWQRTTDNGPFRFLSVLRELLFKNVFRRSTNSSQEGAAKGRLRVEHQGSRPCVADS